MAEPQANSPWSLEVVRGAEVGRRFSLPAGETVAGNALNGMPGLDLSAQESGPRRMAARQARFVCQGEGLSLLDLGSPGGTFVNRERLTPFQPRTLKPGDVVQMAGVQLRVERASGAVTAPAAPRARPAAPAAGFSFTMRTGMVCRSWDDFLTASAQDWSGLRDELVSGRLAAFLAGSGRAALAPDPNAPGSPDERLDAWLATIPSTRTPAPELEVHPDRLAIAHAPGGGTTRRALTITNTGYRLLRSTLRIEPADASWLRVETGSGLVTVDRTSVPIEIIMPESLPAPLSASLVVQSNGGERRVAVTLEPKAAIELPPEAESGPEPDGPRWSALIDRLRTIPPRRRILGGAAFAMIARAVLGVSSAILMGSTSSLQGPALVLAALGMVAGIAIVRRRGTASDALAGAVAGGVAGVLGSAVIVAVFRAVESTLGIASFWLAIVAWGVIGAAVGGLSLVVAPKAEAQP